VLHVEVQTEKDTNIGKRMFEYFIKLYLKHGVESEIEQIVIFLDSDLKFRPHFFDFQLDRKTKNRHEFIAIKLWDWKEKITIENLHLGEQNIFKFIILSQLESIKNSGNPAATANSLIKLSRAVDKAGYTEKEIELGWAFVHFVTNTRDPKVIELIEQEEEMSRKSGLQEKEPLDFWARAHLQIGEAKGREKGLIEGKLEGEMKAKLEMIQTMIESGISEQKALTIAKLSAKDYKKELEALGPQKTTASSPTRKHQTSKK
jgi:predicted transposase/invertase (TIGR01784 family)